MSRTLPLLSAVILLACVACGGGNTSRTFVSIGTGGTGGIYYPLGGALASRLSTRDSTRRYTAEVTGGAVENVNRIVTGEMDLGTVLSITMYEAYRGGEDYPEPRTNLRAVAPLYPSMIHVVAATSGPVTSVQDMRGRRVSVGSAGAGTEQVARHILSAYGLSYDDVDVQYLSFRESADALRDNAIDAAFFAAGYPVAAVLEVTTAGMGRLVALDVDQMNALVEERPYYGIGAVPAGAYPGMETDVRTITVMNWLAGAEDLADEVVTAVLDVLDQEQEALRQVHEIAAQIDLEVLAEPPPIPLHAQTVRWFEAFRLR